jgi:threonine/homoserine/homoserine lactone efflux protein
VPSLESLGLFAAAAVAITLVPGPSMIYILSRGITAGRRPAIATALGVESANVVFVAATTAGLAAVLAASALALSVVRWAGVAYLLYLGVCAFLRGSRPPGFVDSNPAPAAIAYREGLLVGLSNPKVVLFFLSLFPQFVNPDHGSAGLQVLVLGAVFVAIGLAVDLTNAVLAGRLGAWLRRHPGVQRRQHIVEAASYLGLGSAAALSGVEPRR